MDVIERFNEAEAEYVMFEKELDKVSTTDEALILLNKTIKLENKLEEIFKEIREEINKCVTRKTCLYKTRHIYNGGFLSDKLANKVGKLYLKEKSDSL